MTSGIATAILKTVSKSNFVVLRQTYNMPNTKSAIKALRQSENRRVKNLSQKRRVKKLIKQFRALVSEGNVEEASKQLSLIYKTLDKAAKVGVIKKNKSSRLKSRLSNQLNKALAPASPSPSEG